jgi:hypothetical protein
MLSPPLALLIAAAVNVNAATEAPRLQALPGKHAGDRPIVLSADVACPPDRSFGLWATERGATAFFAPAAHIDPKVGGRYTIIFFPSDDPQGLAHGTAGAHVLAADPGRFLAFEWVVFAGDTAKGDRAPPYAPPAQRLPSPLPTWVELSFTPAGAGTHVELRHYGFGKGNLWSQSQAWFTRAWGGVLSEMKAVCAKGPGAP